MAEGSWARYWLTAFLSGCSVIAALARRIARMEAGGMIGFPKYLSIGLIVGLLSAFFITRVESMHTSELTLYTYDVWWPPLAIWVTACLIGSAISALRLRREFTWCKLNFDLAQICGIGIAVSVLAFVAISERSLVFDDSVWLWRLILIVAAPISLSTTWYFAAQRHLQGKIRQWIFAIVSLALGFWFAWEVARNPKEILVYLTVWAILACIALSLLAHRRIKELSKGEGARSRPADALQLASADWSVQYGSADAHIEVGTATTLPTGGYGSDTPITFPENRRCYRFTVTVPTTDVPPGEIELLVAKVEPDDGKPCHVADAGNDNAEAFGTELFVRGTLDRWCEPPRDESKLINLGGKKYEARLQISAGQFDARPIYAALLIFAIAFSLAALFLGYGHVGTAVALAIFFISWTVLSDILWRNGILNQIAKLLGDPGRLRRWLASGGTAFGKILTSVSRWIGSIFSSNSWYGTAFKLVFAVVLLIALAELPNAGRTIVMPFEVSSYAAPLVSELTKTQKDGSEALGRHVSDLVLLELKTLSTQLARDVSLHVGSKNVGPKGERLELYAFDTGKAEQAIAKSGSVELPGGVKLPIQLLLWPIQQPMRWLLDVNVVNGTVAKHGSEYEIMATSSRGNAWRISETNAGDPPIENKDEKQTSPEQNTNASNSTQTGALLDMARRLAFRIVIDSNIKWLVGMTRNWHAYRDYTAGVEKFEPYWTRPQSDLTGLEKAIRHLEKATNKDPGFAWAYYYLGLALKQYGQPLKAQYALEKSLEANPAFVPAKLALAYHIANPESMGLSLPPGWMRRKQPTEDTLQKTRKLWLSVIEDSGVRWQDQAGAYIGLANLEYRVLIDNPGDGIDVGKQHKNAALAAHYFARRAIRGYEKHLPDSEPATGSVQAHAHALNLAGVIFDSVARVEKKIAPVRWSCMEGERETSIRSVYAGPYTASAFNYYRAAAAKLPNDVTIQCNAAYAALGIDNPEPMNRLRNVAAYRSYAGTRIQNPANVKDLFRELREYQSAFQLDPMDIVALNNFAYSFYVFRRDHPEVGESADWLLRTGLQAEESAREAVRLAKVTGHPQAAVYKSTLGEVLLALNRPGEAVEVFENMVDDLPKHLIMLEPRWDLAQAYLCQAARGIDKRKNRQKAQSILSKLREQDLSWDVPFYRHSQKIFVASTPLHMCKDDPEYSLLSDKGIDILYELRQTHFAHKPCTMNFVRIKLPGAGVFNVKIWGPNGMREELNGANVSSILSWGPIATKGKYFVRLYKGMDYVPVSSVETIETYAECDKNGVEIWFEESPGS